MSDDEFAVIVKDLYKSFKLPHEQHSGIKQYITSLVKGAKGYEVQKVLNNVSFEVKKGEFFGIVGRNGSGKSTLLKLLAGIYAPDSGLVKINGMLTPFIELGVGFNPELTGRENVFLNGALLGFSRAEMLSMYDEIVEFAEIEKFMDQKLKNYSSGMQVRLAFSIAIRANTPILLIDEVLAVGDTKFQNKCYAEFRKMKVDAKTIILVTHDMSAVERFCDRVLVLQAGEAKGVYTPSEASIIYERMNVDIDKKQEDTEANQNQWGTGEVTVADIAIFDQKEGNKPTNIVNQGSDIRLNISLKNRDKPKDVIVGLAFYDTFGVNISGPNSGKKKISSSKEVSFTIPQLSLIPGEYTITIAVYNPETEEIYDHIEAARKFTVVSDTVLQYGKINLFGKWEQ